MSTAKEQAYALVAGVAGVRLRPMMGEWLVYFNELFVGTIENGMLFVKDVASSRAALAGAPLIALHAGARPALLVEGLDAAALFALFSAMEEEMRPHG